MRGNKREDHHLSSFVDLNNAYTHSNDLSESTHTHTHSLNSLNSIESKFHSMSSNPSQVIKV